MTLEQKMNDIAYMSEQKGIELANFATAREMIENKEPIEKIVKYSHLTVEQIENLKQSMHS